MNLQDELRKTGRCGVPCFKDRFCDYRGPETWCDRTRARCVALENEHNFDSEVPKRPDLSQFEDIAFLVLSAAAMAVTWLYVEHRSSAAACYFASTMIGLPMCRIEISTRIAALWAKLTNLVTNDRDV